MTNEQEQRLHEQLCAYVLGEATSEERAEIERELLRSPELRAQRDTIERTIGLVKTAMGPSESLSPEAAETLYSAASSSRPRAWKSSGFLRLAAGIGAVALGFAIVRETSSDRNNEVACLDETNNRPFDQRASVNKRSENDALSAVKKQSQDTFVPGETQPLARNRYRLGTEDAQRLDKDREAGQTQSPRESAANAPAKPESEMTELLGFGGTGRDADVAEAQEKLAQVNELTRQQRELDKAVQSLGYGGNAPKQESAKNDLGVYYTRDGNVELAKKVEELYAVDKLADSSTRQLKGRMGPSSPGPSGPSTGGPSGPGAVSTGNSGMTYDEYKTSKQAGGKSEASPSASSSPPAVDSKSKGRGTYRGAGDVVPPGGGGGGGGGTGPSSPGPSGPTTGGPTTAGPTGPSGPGAPRGGKKSDQGEVTYAGRLAADEYKPVYDGISRDDDSKSVPYYQLTPAEQQLYLERECRLILDNCVRRPNEKPRDMYFRFWGDNPFEVTALDPQSTFAADVDTASYALARRYLNEGNVPEKAQIRTEEFVNYFKSDVPAPKSGVFAIHTDLAPSRYSTDTTRQMLRVVVRGKDLSKVERPRLNLTFVVDVSGSMREQMRLEMVKTSIRLLVTQLEPYDKIGIVKFSTDASVVLPLTNVSERATIETAIAPLTPEGSTNSNAGLELGYGMALGGLDREATNRVVFLSDGVANVGITDPAQIAERVKPMREKGIYLNTIGVGMNNHNDVLLEQLANKADGMCSYIDTADEAKKQLVDNFSGAFQPIARDVKIQVEFDPAHVLRYRLLGYENRAIADVDFRNDKIDAGELGAGHQVTALYEIERQGTPSNEKPLATVRLRWKEPRNFGLDAESDSATELTHGVAAGPVSTFEGAGQSYRKAVMAAQFAEILRRSVHARGDSLDTLLNDAVKLQAEMPGDKELTEFVMLVSKSKDLIPRSMPACDELCQSIDEVREHYYRRAQIEQIQRDLDQNTLAELKRQNDVLEARLRDLVRRRLENRAR